MTTATILSETRSHSPRQEMHETQKEWSPAGKARGTSMKYPPTPLDAEALRCASTKASEGYPPEAKSAGASMLRQMYHRATESAFIHGHSP
jgi:hypothetical protein